jgi:hypothetical protein
MKKQTPQPHQTKATVIKQGFQNFLSRSIYLIVFVFLLSFSVKAQWSNGTNIYNTNSGNVGIGTSNPQELLDVAGQMKLGRTNLSGRISFARAQDGNYQAYLGWYTDEIFRQFFSGGSSSYRIATWLNNQETDVFTILNTGSVGIGTTSPRTKLDVVGELSLAQSTYGIRLYNGVGNNWAYIKSASPTTGAAMTLGDAMGDLITLDGAGHVGIGTTNTFGYKLAVNGSAIFTEARVKLYGNWPDYVFGKKYNLMPLKDLENYISANNHLPNIPSASEVQKEGINLGDMNAKLLEKIEELTLYIIELKKENEQIKKELKSLSK